MLTLDNNFLTELGLDGMPEEQKRPFLEYVYKELESRVGHELARTMTREQMDEFQKIIKSDNAFIVRWLTEHNPAYHSDDVFINMMESTGFDQSDPRLLTDYVSVKWLELNRPDYAQVVADMIQSLRQEISDNKEQLLAN